MLTYHDLKDIMIVGVVPRVNVKLSRLELAEPTFSVLRIKAMSGFFICQPSLHHKFKNNLMILHTHPFSTLCYNFSKLMNLNSFWTFDIILYHKPYICYFKCNPAFMSMNTILLRNGDETRGEWFCLADLFFPFEFLHHNKK